MTVMVRAQIPGNDPQVIDIARVAEFIVHGSNAAWLRGVDEIEAKALDGGQVLVITHCRDCNRISVARYDMDAGGSGFFLQEDATLIGKGLIAPGGVPYWLPARLLTSPEFAAKAVCDYYSKDPNGMDLVWVEDTSDLNA